MSWEEVEIYKIAKISNNSVSEYSGLKKYVATGDLDLIINEDIESFSFNDKPSRANLEVEANDVLFAKMQKTNKVLLIDIINEKFIYSTGFLNLRPTKKIDSKFLYHYLKSDAFQDKKDKLCSGATQKAINNTNFKKIKIPLPPLSVQKEIVSKLDQADALRQKEQMLLSQYDTLAQSIFYEMFGDPVLNEKGWEVKSLGELGKWQSGGTPSRKNPDFFKGDIFWLSSGELNDLYVSKSEEKISSIALTESSAKLITENSLLLGMYDTAGLKSSINTIPLSCNQAIAFSSLEKIENHILYVYFVIQLMKDFIKSRQRGVRQKNFNLSMIKEITIPFPPIELQNQFAEIIENIEKQKAIVQQQATQSENVFQALLQESFG